MHGATGNIYCGLHEFADMAFLLHLLRPDDWFADIGANVGSYTVLASAVAGAHTISIEPVAQSFELLQRNIRINGIDYLVSTACCAVGRAEEIRQISVDRGPANRIVAPSYQGELSEVEVKPLDAVLHDRPATLWKMDVEGFELEALEGAKRSLADKTLLAIIVETGNDEVSSIMRSYGFHPATYEPFCRDLKESSDRQMSSNQLWVRDADAVSARCRQARKYEVLSVSI